MLDGSTRAAAVATITSNRGEPTAIRPGAAPPFAEVAPYPAKSRYAAYKAALAQGPPAGPSSSLKVVPGRCRYRGTPESKRPMHACARSHIWRPSGGPVAAPEAQGYARSSTLLVTRVLWALRGTLEWRTIGASLTSHGPVCACVLSGLVVSARCPAVSAPLKGSARSHKPPRLAMGL